jgi:hypothetical protein
MRSFFKYLLIGAVIVVVGIQFVRPDRTNPPIDPARDIVGRPSFPPDVHAILERSCFDCHSNRTHWPWYSQVAPASWLVVGDVNEGRKHLNFSEWEGYKTGRQVSKLESLMGEVDKGTMPPGNYVLLHSNAALSAAEKDRILRWAEDVSDSLGAATK